MFNADLAIGSRLDKFLISKDLSSSTVGCDITPCPLSDYDFVCFVFEVPESIKHGPGLWKLNISLLDNARYCDVIEKTISDHLAFLSVFPSIQDWREFLKESIKRDSIDFSCNQRKQLSRDRVRLTNQLIRLRQQLVKGDISVQPFVLDIKSKLKSFYTHEMEGVKISSRAFARLFRCRLCHLFLLSFVPLSFHIFGAYLCFLPCLLLHFALIFRVF